jgi:hypothetical protein
MTVCTNDLALCHLVEDALPLAVSQALPNAELLVAQVIELEHDRIRLSAVQAEMLTQVGDEVGDPLCDELSLAAPSSVDVSPAVSRVVLLLVPGPTRAAIVIRCPWLLRRHANSSTDFSSSHLPQRLTASIY